MRHKLILSGIFLFLLLGAAGCGQPRALSCPERGIRVYYKNCLLFEAVLYSQKQPGRSATEIILAIPKYEVTVETGFSEPEPFLIRLQVRKRF